MKGGKGLSRHRRRDLRRGHNTNWHHVVPRAICQDNSAENLIEIDRRWHDALHMVFGADHPREYLVKATQDPTGYAQRWVFALARYFGTQVVEAALREATGKPAANQTL